MSAALEGADGGDRRLRRWLLVSVSINILLLCFIAVRLLSAHDDGHDATVAQAVERYAKILPPADTQILRAAFEADRARIEQLESDSKARVERLERRLAEETIDPDTLRREAHELRDLQAELLARAYNVYIEAVLQMSPEGRRIVAEDKD